MENTIVLEEVNESTKDQNAAPESRISKRKSVPYDFSEAKRKRKQIQSRNNLGSSTRRNVSKTLRREVSTQTENHTNAVQPITHTHTHEYSYTYNHIHTHTHTHTHTHML